MKRESFFYSYKCFFWQANSTRKKEKKEKKEITSLMCLFLLHKPKGYIYIYKGKGKKNYFISKVFSRKCSAWSLFGLSSGFSFLSDFCCMLDNIKILGIPFGFCFFFLLFVQDTLNKDVCHA